MVLEINATERSQQRWIPKFELAYFTSNFNAVFCKRYHFIGYWWIIQTFWYLILKRGLKGTYLHIWKEYLTHETIRQDKCPKYNGSSILLCQKHYCVQQVTVKENIVSTLAFNIHLFNFPMSTCCSHHASHCVAL